MSIDIFLKHCQEQINRRDMTSILRVDKGERFYLIRDDKISGQHPKGCTFARVEILTGDIYSQFGKKRVGNINSQYQGAEFINSYGVIVNNSKLLRRLQELTVE